MKFSQLKGKLNLFGIQEEVLEFWRKEDIFAQSIESRSEQNKYSFYDGPPFITGMPHYATLLPSIAKDVVPRYWTMRGKRVRRVWGWDCHGLPAETQVEKQLGIKSKREIEALGVDKFVRACKEYVADVSGEWRWYIDHIGRWVDMDRAYRTMDRDYMETVIWVFKQLYEQGLIYEGLRSSLYCPRCATPLSKFEITMDEGFYREVEDPAVSVKFKIKGQNRYLLAWTTTPWTLPGNRALAVDSAADYAEVVTPSGETVILAKQVYDRQTEKPGQMKQVYKGAKLVGLRYEPLYVFGPSSANDWLVYAGSFVTMEDGTGIVHVAPAFGEDDFELGKGVGLSLFVNIDEEGKFVSEVEPYQGRYIGDVNNLIIADLDRRGRLWRRETIKHSYPFCYRCETPLIYKAQRAWYFKIGELRADLLRTNERINWVPEHFKAGRFKYNLANAPDWCLSRTRYFGTPIPIWRCGSCGAMRVIGSIAELEKLSGRPVPELHRPDIDQVVWACHCQGVMKRVPEILDVWFESGAMPYAERHYPFANERDFNEGFPADFVVEYTGQLRGWFYYLHVIANALRQSPAFKNVVVTGVMKGNDGRKMSKSFGNYPDPKATIQKYGGETLRLYFMSNDIMRGEDMNIVEEDMIDHYRRTMMTLWNSYRYFLTYAEVHDFEPSGLVSEHVLDRWIRGQVERLLREIDEGLKSYDYVRATRALRPFIDGLSTWYIRRSRARFVAGDKEALETLYYVLVRLARAAAPLLPFTAEAMYRNLVLPVSAGAPKSVHLTDWPEVDEAIINERQELNDQMEQVRLICSLGNALRQESNLSLRQGLQSFQIRREGAAVVEKELIQLVLEELNVKSVAVVPELAGGDGWVVKEENGVAVALQIELTAELKSEGLAREVIRHGQVLRQKAGYVLTDRVRVVLSTKDQELAGAIDKSREKIALALQADEVGHEKIAVDASEEVEIDGRKMYLGVKKCE